MYFQICSKAHPQHSGKRYRTIGPVVLKWLLRFVYHREIVTDLQVMQTGRKKVHLSGYAAYTLVAEKGSRCWSIIRVL